MKKEQKKPNILKIEFIDNTRLDAYNESTSMTKKWYEEHDGQTLSLEMYYQMCKEFAAAMGFSEKSINEWFGEY